MTASMVRPDPQARLVSLLGFLDQDPTNLTLIADAATSALECEDAGQASSLLERYGQLAPLPPSVLNLKGLAAIADRRFGDAAEIFTALLEASPDDSSLRFNLAWSRAMLDDYAAVPGLIDEAVVMAIPRAAALKVQAMHHLGLLEDALAAGAGFAEIYPDDESLMGAMAIVALDADQPDLARAYAARAGAGSHEGQSTLGMLALNAQDPDEALTAFDKALKVYPECARALLGRGLVLMAKSDAATAARTLDHGAGIFGDHIGSWVAAGWAHLVAGDRALARQDFERALSLDESFAESQGSLAVLDIMEGDLESGRRRTEVAYRLDRQCYSASLARSLLAAADGDPQQAEKIRTLALNTPFGAGGVTIAQAMARFGAVTPKR